MRQLRSNPIAYLRRMREIVCVIKSIRGGEYLIDYNLNHIDTNKATTMGEMVHTMHI